ncbi:DEAD/DEAH box helicase [Parahaliea sp. F7430]|uniref:DEAD/DEAH box helicase n=1 Tax=Sediminihaliea albiluteola TaxID=2758564 RepID=A0A7W2TVN2_9GAMM|nr:DEAD/DEAH box helicase [Sediminihaliea albiluteola]MBA6412793.1 DEAD/DEAH box helicase [Sediminihaliea albiluteola]
MLDHIDLDRRLRLAIDSLQLEHATPIQQQFIPVALSGRDIKASAETGSGKTLAYLLPVVQRLLSCDQLPRHAGTLILILVPTRELARQVLKQSRKLIEKTHLRAAAITGGADFKYQKSVLRENPEIIIATPGRILEHCESRSADLSALLCLVLDEADRMLEMGFREDVLKINEYCAADRQALFLSATLRMKGLSELSAMLLSEPETIAVGEIRQAHSNIHHQRILADSQEHKDNLLLALLEQQTERRSLVFANKRSTATRLAGLVSQRGIKADCLHGDMSTEDRKRVMTAFSEGKIQVLCASDLAARGLDVPNIDSVINYDLPRSGDDYLHRTGRTGRAGASGLAISLVDASQWNLMSSIQRYLNTEFEARSLPGLKAKYSGPKKLKSSGKAASSKKKSSKKQPKAKQRARDLKNKGKPAGRRSAAPNDGTAPLMKKKRLPPKD